jgi:hypothetical protein
MNTKIILSLGSAILLTTSLLASDMKEMKSENPQKNPQKVMKDKSYHKRDIFISAVMKLKLSSEQKTEIQNIMKQNRQNMPKIRDAFGEKSFDKELYIKLSQDKKSYMLQRRANMIESIYKVLNDSQKKELKNMMNQKRANPKKQGK